jgi:hypothetical protein
MGRNRVLGSPFQPAVISTDTTTQYYVDQYLVDAALGSPVTVTLDPNAVQGDQVVIQDVANNAGTQQIVIAASPDQTIVGVGDSISVTTDGGGVQLTYDQDLSWVATVLTLGPGGGGAIDNVFGAAPIVSSGGVSPTISITPATEAAAGSMSAADKTKLDGITPGAAVASVSGVAPIASSGGTTPAISITAATEAAAGSMSAADKTKLDGIIGSDGGTAATVTSGQTYNVLSTDKAIRFDTTGGSAATADMAAPSYIGQRITFYWWAWSVAQVPPVINVDAGHAMVPFQGPQSSGAGGLVTSTTIATPGATYTLEWDGTEWTSV